MVSLNNANVLILMSGGPTRVINRTLVALVRQAKKNGAGKILGAECGVEGILKRRFFDLKAQPDDLLEKVAQTPGNALGWKRKNPSQEECVTIAETIRDFDIKYVFFVGGDDSARATLQMSQAANGLNLDTSFYHVAKTVDNDLRCNYVTPGFASAALYVANCVQGIAMDSRSQNVVHLVVAMGKDAGFLAAASILARTADSPAPHRIFLPEYEFDMGSFLDQVDDTCQKNGQGIIVVSEGIWTMQGGKKTPLIETISKNIADDGFGGKTLSGSGALGDCLAANIKGAGICGKATATTLNYPQRSYPMTVAANDVIFATQVGEAAIRFALEGEGMGSVALQYAENTIFASLENLAVVGSGKREMPDMLIDKANHTVTDSFISYARRVVGEVPDYTAQLLQQYV